MTFAQALVAVCKGKKVRRTNWEEGEYIDLHADIYGSDVIQLGLFLQDERTHETFTAMHIEHEIEEDGEWEYA